MASRFDTPKASVGADDDYQIAYNQIRDAGVEYVALSQVRHH
jgi:hypothetical protein